MSKYTAKKTKKQDIIDKSTKKKRKNGVLAYFMEKLVSENLVSENILEMEKRLLTDDEMEEINGQFIAEKNID